MSLSCVCLMILTRIQYAMCVERTPREARRLNLLGQIPANWAGPSYHLREQPTSCGSDHVVKVTDTGGTCLNLGSAYKVTCCSVDPIRRRTALASAKSRNKYSQQAATLGMDRHPAEVRCSSGTSVAPLSHVKARFDTGMHGCDTRAHRNARSGT